MPKNGKEDSHDAVIRKSGRVTMGTHISCFRTTTIAHPSPQHTIPPPLMMKRTWSKVDNDGEASGPVAGPSTMTSSGPQERIIGNTRFDIPSSSRRPSRTTPYTMKGRRVVTKAIEFVRRRSSRGSSPDTTPNESYSDMQLSFSTYARDERAQSEPPELLDEDGIEEASVRFKRAQSELVVRNPCEEEDVELDDEQILGQMAESQHPPRAPSPAETEVDDPESQDVVRHTLANGVKVRDFAFVIKGDSDDDTLPSIATTALPFKTAPEVFDPLKALAECEFRWTQNTRRYPIAGRSARRLLDMGWLTQEEWDRRAHPIDIEALARHDSRPYYPWRPLRWTSVPDLEQRRSLMMARAGFFHSLDRVLAGHEFREARTREAEEAGEAALRKTQMKRRMEEEEEEDGEEDGHKKRRITPEGSVEASSQPLRPRMPSPHPALIAPPKQYPAPLHTYNPILYPDAASVILSSSQPRPVVPERADTPPVNEEELRQQQQQQQQDSPGGGNRLVRRKIQRGISRSQTMQLIA